MSSSSDPNTSQGPAGTARIDAASKGAGPEGTARIDAGAAVAGPAGTARIDSATAGPTGPAGTARVGEATGAGGTARVVAEPVHAPQADKQVFAQHLIPGQMVVFKGRSYRVESILSTTTSEARTYVVEKDGRRFVLKVYRAGVHAPMAALEAIHAQPHPNVVAIHDKGHEAGQDFEVLEYFPEGTLDQLLQRQGPLRDLALLRLLVAQITDGLQHLHEQVGLIYQDLKPENVLISGPGLQRVVLTDFGISTLRQGKGDVEVTANGTREYAAPELARFGNETKTLVSEKVDYFALGITLLECWLGSRPFQGIPDGLRISQIREREVQFPAGMEASLETLIKGLISPSVKERFGLQQVRRWLAGQSLQVDYASVKRVYERLAFLGDEVFETPAQLAALLEKYPVKGLDYLYEGTISKWLDTARDLELGTEIAKIVRQFDLDDASRAAGLRRAIYTLDVRKPFVSRGGKRCLTYEEMGDALLDEKEHYLEALTSAFDPLYLYLNARGEGEYSAQVLASFENHSASRALNKLVYDLHRGERNSIKLAGRHYLRTEEFVDADEDALYELREGLFERNSRVLLWLQSLGIVEQLEGFSEAKAVDQLSITQAIPLLKLKELAPGIEQRGSEVLEALVRSRRLDLVDECRKQGLHLDFNKPFRRTFALAFAACNGRVDDVRFMLENGADVDAIGLDGWNALGVAVFYRELEVVRTLVRCTADLTLKQPGDQTFLGLALTVSKDGKNEYPINLAIVEALLNAGADPNVIFNNDLAPLHRAIQCEPVELASSLMDMLLMAGADVNKPSGNGVLPLHIALGRPVETALTLVEKLLVRGAETRRDGHNYLVKDGAACNALLIALYCYHFKHKRSAAYLPVIERLLNTGVPVDTLNQGKSPLHLAAEWGDEALARLLLKHGANPNQVGDGQMLPATYARLGKSAAVETLLAPGLGPQLRAFLGQGSAALVRAVGLIALIASLLSIESRLIDSLSATGSLKLGSIYAHLLLTAMAIRATAVGNVRALKAILLDTLGTFAGWMVWLIIAPLVLAALGYLGGKEIPIAVNSSHWVIFGLSIVLSILSIWLTQRADLRAVVYTKYRSAKTGDSEKSTHPNHTRVTLILSVVLASVIYSLFL